jgi:hypothetical protein
MFFEDLELPQPDIHLDMGPVAMYSRWQGKGTRGYL